MNHRIIIVEDDLAFSLTIERNILSWGYSIIGIFEDGEEFLEKYEALKPTLILMDITLKGAKTGIEVAKSITDKKIPIIYITNSNDNEVYNSIPNANSTAFLVKPFHMLSLRGAIDLHNRINHEEQSIFLKKKGVSFKVNSTDLFWIKSDRNYCDFRVNSTTYTEKVSLTAALERMNLDFLVKIHKSFAVNINKVDSFSSTENMVFVDKNPLPIGRKYKKQLMQLLEKRNINK